MESTTYVTTVGRFGAAIAHRLQPSALLGVHQMEGPAEIPAERRGEVLPRYRQELTGALKSLLRAGATTGIGGGQGRLDLWLVADVEEVGGGLVAELCHAMSTVLADSFSVMFPPDTQPDQRSVGLVVVLATPAVDSSDSGTAARESVAGIEQWHLAGPPSPILNRLYLLPRQNEVMPLSDEDVERAVALFVSMATLPGLRETEAFRRRLGPPRDQRRLLDSFAVAAADIDVERVVSAFSWRSAASGLERLSAQCEGRRTGPVHAPELDIAPWLSGLGDEGAGRELRARTENTPAIVEQLVLNVDLAEADGIGAARAAVRELVDGRIGGPEALTGFRPVAVSLQQAAERLRALAADPSGGWLPSATAQAAAMAEESGASERAPPVAAVRKPSEGSVAPALASWVLSALLLAAITGAAAAALAAVGGARAMSPSGGGAAPGPGGGTLIGANPTTAIMSGVAFGLLIGAGWFLGGWAVHRRSRRDEEPEVAPSTPKSARTRWRAMQIDASLALRRRRVAAAALHIVEDERLRLAALRGAVHEAQRHAHDQLRERGVVVGERLDDDDYARLLDQPTPLHMTLVPPKGLPRLWERSRAVRDDDNWAAKLLGLAYAPGEHRDDLPFSPGGAWEASLRQQHASLVEQGVFAWPDLGQVLQEQVAHFLEAAPQALRLGVRPRRADGTPQTLTEAHELVIVAPPEGKSAVQRALSLKPIAESKVFSATGMAGVLVLRTAGEFDSASLGRMK